MRLIILTFLISLTFTSKSYSQSGIVSFGKWCFEGIVRVCTRSKPTQTNNAGRVASKTVEITATAGFRKSVSNFLSTCYSCKSSISEVIIENGILKFNFKFSHYDYVAHNVEAVIAVAKHFDGTALDILKIRQVRPTYIEGYTWNFSVELTETMINAIKLY